MSRSTSRSVCCESLGGRDNACVGLGVRCAVLEEQVVRNVKER